MYHRAFLKDFEAQNGIKEPQDWGFSIFLLRLIF